MKFRDEEKAQGALEYLIILAGAVLVAVAVGWYLKNVPGQTEHKFNIGTNAAIHGF